MNLRTLKVLHLLTRIRENDPELWEKIIAFAEASQPTPEQAIFAELFCRPEVNQ